MPDVDELAPPLQFSNWPLWLLLALGVIAVVVAWYLIIPLIAVRAAGRRPEALVVYQPQRMGPMGARERAIAAIAAVETDHASGLIDGREAHLRLSAIVRGFAWDMSAVDARTMTLTELKGSGLAPIAEAVSQFYPIAFREEETEGLGSAADVARGAVTTWS